MCVYAEAKDNGGYLCGLAGDICHDPEMGCKTINDTYLFVGDREGSYLDDGDLNDIKEGNP
jgi:hypothetical protein